MEKEQKTLLVRIIAAGVLFAASFIPFGGSGIPETVLRIAAYLTVGGDVLYSAVKNIFRGRLFDESFLMTVATVGAVAIGEYAEAAAVMLFYQTGELLCDIAVDKSRKSISSLMDIRPDYANIEKNGELVKVSPEDVPKGSTVIVKPGEKIPLDGVVTAGSSALNTSALTGESLPRDVSPGDEVISGCVNLTGMLRIRTLGTFGESTVSKILRLVEQSDKSKAKTEKFITRFARIYTPAVVGAALLLAVIPPFFDGMWMRWISRALTFLVISCPCALVISVPLGFFGGIGGASSRGILIKGSNYLEALARAETVVFDKTGTLTKGNFKVTVIHPEVIGEDELLEIAALAESYSDHPISLSLRSAYNRAIDRSRIGDVENLAGEGIRAVVDGREVYAGNEKLMGRISAVHGKCEHSGTVVHVCAGGVYVGHIVISDEIKPGAKEAVSALRAVGVKKTVMLTGDCRAVGESVGAQTGIDEVCAELLPAGKVAKVEQLIAGKTGRGSLVFVGDGINDAPVLKRADAGIAMGGIGSDAAIEAADVVLMDDDPRKVAKAVEISRRTLAIVKQNIVFALTVKAATLLLGALGYAGMWAAVFADVGVTVIAVLNSLRAMNTGK